jgi:hypothetical protein
MMVIVPSKTLRICVNSSSRTEFGSNIPLEFAHARAPINTEPLIEVQTSFVFNQSANSWAFCWGTMRGIITMLSVAREYTPMLGLPTILDK